MIDFYTRWRYTSATSLNYYFNSIIDESLETGS